MGSQVTKDTIVTFSQGLLLCVFSATLALALGVAEEERVEGSAGGGMPAKEAQSLTPAVKAFVCSDP